MFNRGSIYQRRNANNSTPPPYNRGPWERRRNATRAAPPLYNRGPWEPRRNVMHSSPPPYNREPLNLRRDVIIATLPLYFGATTSSQKCQLLIAPMGRVNHQLQQCQPVSTLPHFTTGGQVSIAEMPCIVHPHLTTGGHPNDAAMLFINRSRFTWCRSTRAEMPLYWRTNNQRPAKLRRNATTPSPRIKQGDPLWINVTKTQPLPRYI